MAPTGKTWRWKTRKIININFRANEEINNLLKSNLQKHNCKNLTQLSEVLGFSNKTLERWARGENSPTKKNLEILRLV